jgi:AcrR family transcriptional regulator
MGKAFTDEERLVVQEKLRRTGIELFRKNGIKGVSIRSLTSEAGIAQGGFYTFYKDKYDFLLDIIEFRIKEKLQALRDTRDRSLNDPAGYLSEMMYMQGMHLTTNKAFDNSISGTLDYYQSLDAEATLRIRKLYRDYLEDLIAYWKKNGYKVRSDVDGLLWSIRMESFMITNASMMDPDYMSDILKSYCSSVVDRYLSVSR